MDEAIKSRVILILSLLGVILFISTVSSCNSSYRQKLARDKEMASRMDLEERVSKFNQEKAALDDKISALQKELDNERAGREEARKELSQEQLTVKALKEELQKVSDIKAALESDLKESVSQAKSGKSKK